MTLTAIASRLGLAVNTINAYHSKGQMPEPDVVISGVKFWREATIREWRAHARSGTSKLD